MYMCVCVCVCVCVYWEKQWVYIFKVLIIYFLLIWK
jgi:hypothetical protein